MKPFSLPWLGVSPSIPDAIAQKKVKGKKKVCSGLGVQISYRVFRKEEHLVAGGIHGSAHLSLLCI